MLNSDSSNFLKFVNAIINDAIYLLDESLSKLSEIRSYQIEMQNKEAWSQQDAVPHSPLMYPSLFGTLIVIILVCTGDETGARASLSHSRAAGQDVPAAGQSND